MANEQARETRRVAGGLAVGLARLNLGAVEDPRSAALVRRPLRQILVGVLLSLAAGSRSLRDMERTTARLSHAIRKKLALWGKLPDTTARDLLMKLSPKGIRAVLHRQVRHAHRSKQLEPEGLPWGVCAIDGKHTRTRHPGGPFAQRQSESAVLRTMTAALVSARATVVLDAVPVPAETNEMGIFKEVLGELAAAYGRLDLFRLVTADAGMTSRENAAAVRSRGWHYLLALKETQPALLDEAVRLIGPRRPSPPAARTTDVRDNRTLEVRSLWLTGEAAGYHDWDHLETVVRVRREVVRDGVVESCDDRYFVSSLTPDELSPDLWLKVVRAHWRVENDVHGVLDVTYAEDTKPWLHATHGQLIVALLRRVVLNIMALHRGVSRRGEARRDVPWRDLIATALAVLLGATEADLDGLRWASTPSQLARGQPG